VGKKEKAKNKDKDTRVGSGIVSLDEWNVEHAKEIQELCVKLGNELIGKHIYTAILALARTAAAGMLGAWRTEEEIKALAEYNLESFVHEVSNLAREGAQTVGDLVGIDIVDLARGCVREVIKGKPCPSCGQVHIPDETIEAALEGLGAKDISQMPEEEKNKLREGLRTGDMQIIIPDELKEEMKAKGMSEDDVKAMIMKSVGGLHS
jgi:hypothetical protein